MNGLRGRLDSGELGALLRQVYGGTRTLRDVARLTGGSKKGVYRLTLDDGTSCVLHRWDDAENWWPTAAEDADGPFAPATGLDLFVAAHAELTATGVRVPEILLLDPDGDLAVVEDVRGGSLEALHAREPGRAAPVLARLGELVRALHDRRADRYGRPLTLAPADAPPPQTVVRDRALRHLAECARRVPRLTAARDRIAALLDTAHAAVAPRSGYALIHGELGPDHVLVDDHDRPVLIDIEGVMFFDPEWEHAFLELRFGDTYHQLAVDRQDEARLRLYRLALDLSLVEGPLRLLDGDFPDRAPMRSIADHAADRILARLPSG
ncbi:aminoglycoside phosphotransferase family protein [Micromonospora yasonensis]|uniref:phosphotransferase family protein n=1 Tax=Micromonospora yasonensis TaxID=1128667 RepID=UPI002230799B|nr:aminoglycoside phosphotransferase family protein [Micromonospora yasonensis]MCW3842906.1 aminoglycoside phosphotransferase family protein [Micromonospora yasonensis]